MPQKKYRRNARATLCQDPENQCDQGSENGSVSMAEQLELERVVNIVGMVGAGKTTLLKVLAYILDQRKKRTVIVTDTVAEVFQLYRYFRSLGCQCSR